MATQPRRFILQAIDPDLGHSAFEAMFIVEHPEKLRAILGEAAMEDPDLDHSYTLEPEVLIAISRTFEVPFDAKGRTTCLYQWTHQGEVLPYLAHTGYELALLLEGRKRFARMYYEYPPERHPEEDRFDRYVAQGALHKEVELEPFDKPIRTKFGQTYEGVRTAYYTRRGEEWRVAAWKLVCKASAKAGWNDSFERLEGMLFGYEDWQNDWWIADRRKREREFGTLLVYLAVSSADLAAIEHSGFRAFPPTQATLKIAVFASLPESQELASLLESEGVAVLVRFRVKTRLFFDLVNFKQGSLLEIPADRIKDLNRLIIGEIEVVSRYSDQSFDRK
jgi:hypothetical protein